MMPHLKYGLLTTLGLITLQLPAQDALFSTRQDVSGIADYDMLCGMSRTASGDILTFGICYTADPMTLAVCVSQFSAEGEFLSTRSFSQPGSVFFLERDRVAHYGQTMHAAAVQRDPQASVWLFDSTGDTLWTHEPIGTGRASRIGDVAFTTDGSLLLCGAVDQNTSSPKVFLARYSNTGVLEALIEFPAPAGWTNSTLFVRSMDLFSDGGGVISGSREHSNGSNGEQWVLRFDSDGNLLYCQDLDGPGEGDPAQVVTLADGSYTVSGMRRQPHPVNTSDYCCPSPFFARFAGDGTLIWSRLFHGVGLEVHDFALRALDDGSVISAGFTQYMAHMNAYLFKVSAMGDSLWHREYASPDSSCVNYGFMPHALIVEPDERILIGGVSLPCDNDHWLMRVDASGMPPPSISLVTSVQETQRAKLMLGVHPNPSSGNMVIDMPDGVYVLRVSVLDLSGRLVTSAMVHRHTPLLELQRPGHYTLRMMDEHGRLFYGKAIVH